MRKTMFLVVAAGVLGGIAPLANAQLVDITQPNTTLASVLGRSFQVGDKIFSVPTNGFQSVAFSASEVFISPVINADPMTGLGFRITGAWNDAPGGGGTDFVFIYDVEITPEGIAAGRTFAAADLRFNGSASGAGSFARVDETVMDRNNMILANKQVEAIAGSPPQLSYQVNVQGQTRLRLVKDVQFFANGDNGTAAASFIDQTFGQVIIPLPSAAGLGLAGLGVVAMRRRRA